MMELSGAPLMLPIGIFGLPGPWEAIIVAVIAMLLFGHRLPGMARSLGQGIVEFRKGLKGDDKDKDQIEGGGDGDTANAGDGR